MKKISGFSICMLCLILPACVPAAQPVEATTSPLIVVPSTTPAAQAEDEVQSAFLTDTLIILRGGREYEVVLGLRPSSVFMKDDGVRLPMPEQMKGVDWLFDSTLEYYGDLDGDRDLEYVVFLEYFGGSCSGGIQIYDYDPSADSFVNISDFQHFPCSTFDSVEDLDDDGFIEIIVTDAEYNLALGGGGALASIAPIKIYRFKQGEFIAVTQEFPELVEADAAGWLDWFQNFDVNEGGHLRLELASYLADMVLLGRGEEGLAKFNELCLQYLDSGEAGPRCEDYLFDVNAALEEQEYK